MHISVNLCIIIQIDMRIVIAQNSKKEIEKSVYEKFCAYAADYGISVSFAVDCFELKERLSTDEYDCVAIFGGDGSMLGFAPVCSEYGVAILSINMGRVGFLSQLELKDLQNGLKMLSKGDFSTEERGMLRLCDGVNEFFSLNDIVFCNRMRSGTISLNLFVDERFVDRYVGDGLIVSTPTGSTAYSLAAGGPIIYPDLNVTLLTPLCAHSLRRCPIVVSSDCKISVEYFDNTQCLADGRVLTLSDTEKNKVYIERSPNKVKFIRFKTSDFFAKLFEKFASWSNPYMEDK